MACKRFCEICYQIIAAPRLIISIPLWNIKIKHYICCSKKENTSEKNTSTNQNTLSDQDY